MLTTKLIKLTGNAVLNIEAHKDLSSLHTLACQAQAEHFIAVQSLRSLTEALAFGQQKGLSITVLGSGSNIVCTPNISGLVIQLQNKGKVLLQTASTDEGSVNSDTVRVKVQAGENWHEFVKWSLQQGLRGLENLSLIPGSVGAAPIQNIGAFGVEVESCLESVTAIHKTSFEQKVFSHQLCQFGYRDSVFKNAAKDWIVWELVFCLSKFTPLNTEYSELNKAWMQAGSPDDAAKVSDMVCEIRQRKLPDPEVIPNAGSFFKNPVVSAQRWLDLTRQFPKLIAYPQADGNVKLAAGWLVEKAGWKGFMDGGVGVCETQALVLVNPGRKQSTELLALATRIQGSVSDLFGVNLEVEPIIW